MAKKKPKPMQGRTRKNAVKNLKRIMETQKFLSELTKKLKS